MTKTNKKSGFTLTELLICIAILAVLSAISVPIISGIVNNSRDKNDKLDAELFTSYMAKFANEVPKPANMYTYLDDSEQKIVSSAGNNDFPGILRDDVNTYNTSEELWTAIRKEAVVALKMQDSGITVYDNYLIQGPQNTEMSFIYYYLKGDVKVEKLEDVKKKTENNKNAGIDALENYWVCLDKIEGNTEEFNVSVTGNVFVKLYMYGLEKHLPIRLLENCNITKDIYLQSKKHGTKYFLSNTSTENFYNNNILQFSNVPKGEYQLFIFADNITDLPSPEYATLGKHTTSGIITVSEKGNFAGKTISNPYSAFLLTVSRGTVSVNYKTTTYGNSGLIDEQIHNFDKPYTLDFKNTTFEKFKVSYNSNNYITELYDKTNSKYLPFGDYSLRFSSVDYNDYNANINSSLYGIVNQGSPNNYSSIFDYQIFARKTKVNFSGVIDLGTGIMPLNNELTDSESAKLNSYGINDFNKNLNFRLLFVSDNKTYTLNASDLTPVNGGIDGKYSFTINNVEWNGNGTNYDVYFENIFYDYPVPVTTNPIFVEGYDITLDLSTDSFIPNKNISVKQQVTTDGKNVFIAGDIILTNIFTNQTIKLSSGTALTSVPCGFYKISFTYPAPYSFSDDIVYLINKNENITINKNYDGITISGIVIPPSGGYTSAASTFYSHLKVKIEFTLDDGQTGYVISGNKNGHAGREVTISLNGTNRAQYSATLPLAKSYKVIVEEKDDKCYSDTSKTVTKSGSGNLTVSDITMSYLNSTADTYHCGSYVAYGKTKTGHQRYCQACGLEIDGHWNKVYEKITSVASCTTNGVKTYYCSLCDVSLVEESTPKSGHNMDNGTITTSPTCTATGVKTFKCKNSGCNHSTTESVNALGHDMSRKGSTVHTYTSCTANGYKYYECSRCYTDSSSTYLYEYAWGHNINNRVHCDAKHKVSGWRLSCGHSYYCHIYCANGDCKQQQSYKHCWTDYGYNSPNGANNSDRWKSCSG